MGLKLEDIFANFPEVSKPLKKLSLKDKLIWTGVALLLYFFMSLTPLYGLAPDYVAHFEQLAVLLAANFGSLISLGIGPIVTGSIMLQLLVGADVIKIDLKSPDGKKKYQAYQKMFSVFFIVFENAAYVLSGALPAATPTAFNIFLLIFQLIVAGLMLLFLDEVTSKWGIGSGISLFIAAGVARELFVRAFSPVMDPTMHVPTGAVPRIITLIAQGNASMAFWPFIGVISTIAVFIIAVYFSGVQINIPLSFGKVRGFGMKWPIKWFYTSVMPVILVSALIVSLQIWALMMFNAGYPILGTFEGQEAASGIAMYLQPTNFLEIFQTGLTSVAIRSIVVYSFIMIGGAVFFSYLWLNVSKTGPSDVADQILGSGLSIPGFRRDKRILEKVLKRYIVPLAILGGFTIGALAVLADLFGALSSGTGIMLTVIIVYQFYENIKKAHMEEMTPGLRKLMG